MTSPNATTTPPSPSPPTRNSSYTSLLSHSTSTLSSALSWLLHPDHGSSPPPSAAASPPRRPSPSLPPPLAPIVLSDPGNNHILTSSLAGDLRLLLPARLQLHSTWTLAYSLSQHGVSLSTLFARCAQSRRAAYVLVVKDSAAGVFGAFVNEAFKPTGRYYGTGECFLWKRGKVDDDEWGGADGGGGGFKAFPYSGENEYMILCEQGFLSVGGGEGRYGLWLDDTLERGISERCRTFGNEPLTDARGGKFEVLEVEVWRIGS